MATAEYPLARNLSIDAIDIATKGNEIIGSDNANHGTSYWITSGPKKSDTAASQAQRRFRIENVSFPYAIRPCNVPKMAVPGPDGRLPPKSFQPWDRLSLGVHLDAVAHADDASALTRLQQRLVKRMFDRKDELFTNPEYIQTEALVEMQFKGRFFKPAKLDGSGKETPGQLWPDVVGWGDKIENATVLTWEETKPNGTKIKQSRIKHCTYAPRFPDEKLDPRIKTKPTIFRLRIGDGKWTDRVVLREDGSLDNYDSPVVLDKSGAPRQRLVGPGDLTEGSTGTVFFDPTSISIDKSIRGGLNALVVEFDRAEPKTGSFGLAPVDEADDDANRASISEVDEYFRRQEEAARARAALLTGLAPAALAPLPVFSAVTTAAAPSASVHPSTPVQAPKVLEAPGAPKAEKKKKKVVVVPPPIAESDGDEEESSDEEPEEIRYYQATAAGEKRRREAEALTAAALAPAVKEKEKEKKKKVKVAATEE